MYTNRRFAIINAKRDPSGPESYHFNSTVHQAEDQWAVLCSSLERIGTNRNYIQHIQIPLPLLHSKYFHPSHVAKVDKSISSLAKLLPPKLSNLEISITCDIRSLSKAINPCFEESFVAEVGRTHLRPLHWFYPPTRRFTKMKFAVCHNSEDFNYTSDRKRGNTNSVLENALETVPQKCERSV